MSPDNEIKRFPSCVNSPVPYKAAERIDTVRKSLATLEQGAYLDQEELRSAEAALDFADQLRERRNDGSHTKPRYPFDDSEEIEELLRSAGRHLPPLWRLHAV